MEKTGQFKVGSRKKNNATEEMESIPEYFRSDLHLNPLNPQSLKDASKSIKQPPWLRPSN